MVIKVRDPNFKHAINRKAGAMKDKRRSEKYPFEFDTNLPFKCGQCPDNTDGEGCDKFEECEGWP